MTGYTRNVGSLLAALATLEQVRGGMVCGRIASPAELEAARAEALRLVNDHLIAAARASPGEARAAADAFPSWARPLVDFALLAPLADAAVADNAPPPGDVSAGPFGRFSWTVEAGCYAAKQPLCVGAASLTLSVSDVEPEELPGRLAELPWLRSGLSKVVEKAKLFAAQNGLEMHNGGYAEPESAPTTEGEFCGRLTPTSVSVHHEGVSLGFDDGDLFWGHSVVVDCDDGGSPTGFSMMG